MNQKIELLSLARLILSMGDQLWICYALDKAADKLGGSHHEAANDLIKHVEDNIGRHAIFTSWLAEQVGTELARKWALEARLAWIDKMIHDNTEAP